MERNFQCPDCPKTFTRRDTVKKHVRTVHRGERQIVKCLECPKTLSRQDSLTRHIKAVHRGQRVRVQCPECSDTFSRKSTVEEHVLRVHRGLGLKFQCGECPKEYSRRSTLKEHILGVHRKLKLKKCAECPYASAYHGNVYEHRQTHRGKLSARPIVASSEGRGDQKPAEMGCMATCQLCGFLADTTNALTEHILSAHVEE